MFDAESILNRNRWQLQVRLILLRLLPTIGAIIAGLVIGAVLVSLVGVSPQKAFLQLLRGAVGINIHWSWNQPWSELLNQPSRIGSSLTEATPLILAGLSIAVPFRGGLFNIGAEGQLLMGGLGATIVALTNVWAFGPLHMIASLLAGFLFGGLWGAIPGCLRACRSMNEIITAIMLNFVAFWIVSYLVHGPLKEVGGVGYPWSAEIPPETRLPHIWEELRINLGTVITVAATCVVSVVFKKTTFGYALSAVGGNSDAARFAGMPVNRTLILAMFFGGGLAGLAGATVILGVQFRLADTFSPGYGYDAIAVMFVGQANPIGILFSGIIFGAFRTGAESLELSAGVPKSIAEVIQATTLIFAILYRSCWLARRRPRNSLKGR